MTAEHFTETLIKAIAAPFRLRITGFPACGKTTLSRIIATRIPEIVHIESEAWIHSLDYRKTRDLSGAHPEGYEIHQALLDIKAFISGKSIRMRKYDHHIGDRTEVSLLASPPGVPLILDGTLFSLNEFDSLIPDCIFLRPAVFEDWLRASIKRDVEQRFFSEAEATRHNMRKARDLQLVLERSPRARCVTCHLPSMLYDWVDTA